MRQLNNNEPGDVASAHTDDQWEASEKAYPPRLRECSYTHPKPNSGKVPEEEYTA